VVGLFFGEAGRTNANTNEHVLSVKRVTSLCALIKSHSASRTNVGSTVDLDPNSERAGARGAGHVPSLAGSLGCAAEHFRECGSHMRNVYEVRCFPLDRGKLLAIIRLCYFALPMAAR
jgi:hypothetical protein